MTISISVKEREVVGRVWDELPCPSSCLAMMCYQQGRADWVVYGVWHGNTCSTEPLKGLEYSHVLSIYCVDVGAVDAFKLRI